MFADYYVMTADPWRLAELAILHEFKPGKGQAWAKSHAEIDGESDYGITAVIDAPPCEDTPDGEYPAVYRCSECESGPWGEEFSVCQNCEAEESCEEVPYEDCEDGRNWQEYNGVWLIIEVFPEDEPREGRPIYDSIEDCFPADLVALVPADG